MNINIKDIKITIIGILIGFLISREIYIKTDTKRYHQSPMCVVDEDGNFKDACERNKASIIRSSDNFRETEFFSIDISKYDQLTSIQYTDKDNPLHIQRVIKLTGIDKELAVLSHLFISDFPIMHSNTYDVTKSDFIKNIDKIDENILGIEYKKVR
jgi:hypothetical protein